MTAAATTDADTSTTPTFAGLPADTLPFLRDLRAADRDWFAADRDRYLAAYDAPAKALVTAIGARLPELADPDDPSVDLHAVPAVGGSIFRVTHDTRFRPGTGPYRDHIDLWIWDGERALAPGGLYLRITPEVVRFGVGARLLSREALARYRRAVLDDAAGRALATIVEDLEDDPVDPPLKVQGERLKGTPRGIDPSGLDATGLRLLRHTALIVDVDEPAGPVVGTPQIVDRALQHWRRSWPLHRWLVQHVQT